MLARVGDHPSGCRRGKGFCLLECLLLVVCISCAPPGRLRRGRPERVGMDPEVLSRIDDVAEEEVEAGKVPGCVVLVARKGVIVWEKAYGYHPLQPQKVANSPSTVYDLASLTKPIATATAVALLLEDGKLALEDRVTEYLPSFGQNGKSDVTIADLLAHVSGLKPYLDVSLLQKEHGPGPKPDAVIAEISALPKAYERGKSCVYSCLNFVVLAKIVEEVSGEPMDTFLKRRVWQPLGMNDTGFFPGEEKQERAAPTRPDGSPEYRGKVHDPVARYYASAEHVCGNAGLFSTARDLATFAQMLLNGGTYGGKRILRSETVHHFTTTRTPAGLPAKGMGWDVDSPYSPQVRGEIIPAGDSFGHTGFTGCSLWIDRRSQAFLIILSNRTHVEEGDVRRLRHDIATIVGSSIDLYSTQPRHRNPAQ